MNTDYTKKILSLAAVTNPIERPALKDWETLESRLEVRFPGDFKAIINHLGSGEFGEGLTLKNPVSCSEYLVLSHEAMIKHFTLISDLRSAIGIPLYPESGGAIQIANMELQDFLLLPDSSGNLGKLAWLQIDRGEVVWLDMSISQFIHDLYFNKINKAWASELRNYIWRKDSMQFFKSFKIFEGNRVGL